MLDDWLTDKVLTNYAQHISECYTKVTRIFFFIESSLHFTSAASNDEELFMKRRPL